MADSHDTHQHQGRGFWGCANIFLALAFGSFALLAGAALIFGGLTRAAKQPPSAPTTSPASTGVAPAATAGGAAPPAGGNAAPAPAAAPQPGAASAPSGDLVEVVVKPGQANPMSYDISSIHAKAGQKVKITFKNESTLAPLQHSLILCKPGSRDRIHAAADAMMTDMPKWLAKGFIPETPDVLHHTKLLNPGESQTLEFTAGPEKGEYPYVCTFPGHSRIMQGTLFVE
jgi:azurin